MEMKENLTEQIRRLSTMLEAQRQELDEQRQRLRSLEALAPTAPTLPSPARGGGDNARVEREINGHSRRDLLRLAGAAVAGAAGSVALQAIPAAAASGGALTLGQVNDANATTQLHPSPASSPNPLFRVDGTAATGGDAITAQAGSGLASTGVVGTAGGGDNSNGVVGNAGAGASSTGVLGNAGAGATSAGVIGQAGPALSSAGVVGITTGSIGVFGQATTGIDMMAGGNGRLAQVPFSAGGAGAPDFTPGVAQLEILREDDGSVWVSRAQAGNPIGLKKVAWKRLNAVRVDATDGSGGPFAPLRILDTRNGTGTGTHPGPLLPGEAFDFGSYLNTSGIPSDAVGLIGNLTAVASDANGNQIYAFPKLGWLALTPGGVPLNSAAPVSSLNFGGPVNAVANFFVVGFGTGSYAGKLRVQNGGGTKIHVLIDVFGVLQ
jgi:hypothetical protein